MKDRIRAIMFQKPQLADDDSSGGGGGKPPKEPEAKEPDSKPESVPHERFKEVNDGYVAAKDEIAKYKAADKKRAEDKAKADGDNKELLKLKDTENATLKGENAQLRHQALASKVAAEVGLPANLSGRLVGETEKELRKDAEDLKAQMAPEGAKSTSDLSDDDTKKGGKKPALTRETIKAFTPKEHEERKDEIDAWLAQQT